MTSLRTVRARLGQPVTEPAGDELHQARVDAARRNTKWTEIPADLVPRGRRLYVSASSDLVYSPYQGPIFQTASTTVIPDMTPLHFTVDQDDGLRFYELKRGSWSDRVHDRALRGKR